MTLCACGCGQPTRIATRTYRCYGIVKGQPLRFIVGHARKASPERLATIPVGNGTCACGCGGATAIASKTNSSDGTVIGKPRRFLPGHNLRGRNNPLSKDPLTLYVVNAETGCWDWQGRVNRYGFFGPRQAHIVIYEHFRGAVPAGLQLDHLCRNTRCVNPDHLEPVTQAENNRRAREARRCPAA